MTRYNRQTLFAPIGSGGQQRIEKSRAVIIGCGALGCAQTEMLARAGLGHIRIVDRDFVEESNLQRQTLFTEQDAKNRTPKVVAAKARIETINSGIEVEAVIADVNAGNVEPLIANADVILDGTDNFSTRYLINDAGIKHNIAWIYGAAVGSLGATMTISASVEAKEKRPCLRCIFPDEPPAGSAETCDTAGVIAPIISIVAAAQVAEAFKILVGRFEDLHNSLMQFDVWHNQWRRVRLKAADSNCRTCALREFDFLAAETNEIATVLCGRNAVQIRPARNADINLAHLAARLKEIGEVKMNEYLVRFNIEDYELTVFRDARAIVRGTDDVTTARTLYARYVGH